MLKVNKFSIMNMIILEFFIFGENLVFRRRNEIDRIMHMGAWGYGIYLLVFNLICHS